MENQYFIGWRINYIDASGKHQSELKSFYENELALKFIHNIETQHGEITSIVLYANTFPSNPPFYEKPVTKEELAQVSDQWTKERQREIESSYPQA